MSKTLKQKTAHGIFWSFLDKFGQQGLNIIVGILLMRFFLTPEEYGLVAVIYIIYALSNAMIDSGFSNALIRKKDVSQTDLSSVFYFNIALSVLFYLLIFFIAPVIANLYHKPILIQLVRVMGLGVPLVSLTLVQVTLLTKAINFRCLAIINIISLFFSGALSLFLAWKGYGVWVLVIQPLSIPLIKNICLWSVSTWRPGSIFRKKSIQELWVYSSKLLAASTLNIICRNIYSSLIATYYPFKEAGFYFNANRYSEIPYNTVIPAINTTVYSAMANIGDSSESLKNAFRKTIRVASFAYFPIMLGLIATAEPLMLTVLGTKWLPVVPYFRVLCVGFLFLGMNPFNSIILFLKGKSAVFFNFTLIYNVALLLCIALTLRISVLAMAMSWSITSIIYSVVFTAYIGKMIPYTFGEIIKDILPYFILATVMGVGVYLLSFLIHNPVVLVGMQVLSGAAFYLSATYWLGSKVFREAIGMVKCKISSI